MADSSLEMDMDISSSGHSAYSHRPRHTTPARSDYFPSFSSSSNFSRYPTSRRTRTPLPPTTPFASDNDKSWQGEISWNFEPTGWRDNRNDFGAVVSPWTNPAVTPSSRIFRRTANDYYLSRTSNGNFHSFSNPYYDHSGYDALPSSRLELQSYVARDHFNESSFLGRSAYNAGDLAKSPTFSGLVTINQRKSSPLSHNDDLSAINYDDVEEDERIVRDTKTRIKQNQDPRWASMSHAYADGGHGHDHNYGQHSHHVHGGDGRELASHQYRSDHHGMINFVEEEEDLDEDDTSPPQAVGLIGLFRYVCLWLDWQEL